MPVEVPPDPRYPRAKSPPWKIKRSAMQLLKKMRLVDFVIFIGMAVNAVVIFLILYYFVF